MMGSTASAAEKLRQQAARQKQTLNPRDSAASASQVRFRILQMPDLLHWGGGGGWGVVMIQPNLVLKL